MSVPVETFFMDESVEGTLQSRLQQIIAGTAKHGGSSFWIETPKHIKAIELAQNLLNMNVVIEPGDPFFVGENYPQNFIRLAYSSIPTNKIAPGIELIARAISDTGPITA